MSASEQNSSSEPTNTDLSFWTDRWIGNKIGFHRSAVGELFKTFVLENLSLASGEQRIVVFPLCGKTLDMRAVLEGGHRVIGIEASPVAIKAFFEENNIKYELQRDEEDVFDIYQGIDQPITIYGGDYFAFNKVLPPVDFIWDRGGLVAIPVDRREKYRDVILNMMKPGRTHFYEVAINYDDLTMKGPPHRLTDDHVKDLFGSTCSIEFLKSHDETEEYNSRNQEKKIGFIEERIHLIKKH